MGKGDRTCSKPSSSTRAAEVLAGKTAGAGGFGFGGFAGSSLLGPHVAGIGAAAAERLASAATAGEPGSGGGDYARGEVLLSVQMDGELAQCIRHLAKKDPVTKTKALQNLRTLIPSRSTADLLTVMPSWIYIYNRLILDPSRAVRSEVAATLACLLNALRKSVAPHLKALAGPWFLAMYDTYGDAAAASRSAFAMAFPAERRQLEVLLFCRTELMSYLKDQLAATPQQLGDPKKDSPEELEERHERVQAACLAALAALVTTMTTMATTMEGAVAGEASSPAPPVAERKEVLDAVREVLCRPGFWKATAGSRSAAVRRASYGLARCVAQVAAEPLLGGCAAESAACVLGALGEKEPGNHGPMWEAVLTYAKFFPDGWRHVSLRKMLLPRLYSLLRRGCHGSAAVSMPALLPLLPLLPPGTLGPRPDVLVALLDAVWVGLGNPACGTRAAKSASLSAYRECLAWGLMQSARLAADTGTPAPTPLPPGCISAPTAAAAADAPAAADATAAASGYCSTLLTGSLVKDVLPAALGSGEQAKAARELVAALAEGLCGSGGGGGPLPSVACLGEAVSDFLSGALERRVAAVGGDGVGGGGQAAEVELAAACEGAAALLAQLRGAVADVAGAGSPELAAQAAAAAAQGLMAAGPGGLPPPASQLLATLFREYGSTAVAGVGTGLQPAEQDAVAAGASGGCATKALTHGGGSGYFNLDSLVAALRNGPASGPPAEATSELLVALCSAHHDPPALWEQILAAILPQPPQSQPALPVSRDGDQDRDQDGELEGQLQRALLLLQSCAVAVRPTHAHHPLVGWTSSSLDALALRLARGAGSGAAGAAAGATAEARGAPARGRGQSQGQAAAAALLSATLAANAAGVVLLGPSAAREVVQALTSLVEAAAAATPGAGDSTTAAAAGFAVDVLRGPLSSRNGLWGLLPEPACDAVAALARLAWQAPCGDRLMGHEGVVRGLRPGAAYDLYGDSGSSSVEEEEGEERVESEASDEDDSVAGELDVSSASEDEDEAQSDDGIVSEGEGAAAMRAARLQAARFWEEGRPLAVAAAALPQGRADKLATRLAKLLAAEAAVARLTPRAWAARGEQLLASASGGRAQVQGLLDALLRARPEWRTWSAIAATGTAAGPSSAVAAEALPAPSLEYLARLVGAAGPGALLGGATGVAEEAEEGRVEAVEEGTRRGSEGEESRPAAGGWCWVLVELLCSAHCHSGHRGRGSGGCSGAEAAAASESGLSGAWRRAVRRAAATLLDHVVYGAVAEVEAEGDGDGGDGGGGVYGSLLWNLVDRLAEGCRDGGGATAEARGAAAAANEGGELPATQAAFLDALCHVAAAMQRAHRHVPQNGTHRRRSGGGGGSQLAPVPPLLSLQIRLCRHWLSTCRPDEVTRTGLPPQAVQLLLPLTAGPVRRQAAAAAAAAAAGRHGGAAGVEGHFLTSSGLPELSCAWVRHCLALPAVLLEPTSAAVAALGLAVACFPVPDARGGGSSSAGPGARAGATAAALARSGGAGLAASERLLLKQLVNHQLVRHARMAAARHLQLADGAGQLPLSGPPGGAAAAAAARSAVIRLAHAAVVYDWRSLGQAEWHALLQAVQDGMSDAVAALSGLLGQLAAAARTAADGVLQQPPGTTPPGPMALQLLRKLSQRGVLGRVAQGAQLDAETGEALAGCALGPAARHAAQLAAVLAELQDELAANEGGGTAAGVSAASREYGNTMKACCSHAMQLAITLGGIESYAAAFGPGAAAALAAWLAQHRDFWAAVTRCAGRALAPGREHLGMQAAAAALAAQAAALESAGLDAVGALLAVALIPTPTHGSHLLQPVAYRLLLGDALLPHLTLAESAAAPPSGANEGDGTTAGDVELPEYGGDDVAFLMAGGVRPEMAPWLLPAAAKLPGGAAGGADMRVYLTAWGLLLAHSLELDASSRGLAVLRAVLREAEALVHALLDQLVPKLGLQRQLGQGQALGQGGKHRHGHHHYHHGHHHHAGSARGGLGGPAATASSSSGAQTAAEVGRWRLAEALREVGLPLGPHAVSASSRALFRAVLRALPATARGWFGDLRDRSLAAAVESYTSAVEGPALLAAEIASVQSLKRADERFTVRASSSLREVVASLEVEDGAVLELAVKLPSCLPLRAPEVECRRKVGVNDTRLRKWLLSISTFLRHQNGSVADAILLWKRNVDSEFEGVGGCLICYSVISSVNGQLPHLVCRTCNVRFHPACLYKWFKSAGKSQCPHCQALW